MAVKGWFQKPWFDFVNAYFKPGSPVQPPVPSSPSYRGGVMTKKQSAGDQVRGAPYHLDPQASVLFDRGLRNKPGENNCFLNAAVQVRAV